MSWDQTSRSKRTRAALRGRTRAAVGKVGTRSREALDSVRERVPSGEEIRERAGQARTWAANQLGEHAVALGLSALAVGVAGAVLLPISRGERRALNSVAGMVKRLAPSRETLPRIVLVARTINKVVELSRDSSREAAPKR